MTLTAAATWARHRTEAEWLSLAAALIVFGYVGWDGALWDARLQLLLHLLAIGAVLGLVVVAARGGELPRTAIDVPILVLLTALALATVSALNVGMSLRAMAAIVATAAMLPVALVAIRHRRTWVGMVVAGPVLALSIPTLVALVARRLEWILVGAPGLPPIRLPAEGTPFGSVAVPPFIIWPAWALAGLIEPPRWRRAAQVGLVAVGVPMTLLSGSRSAWLAMAVTLFAAGIPWAWRRRRAIGRIGRPDRRSFAAALVALAAIAAVGIFVAPRVTAVASLVYRASLWRDTLNAWWTDPLLGIGPGFMPYARQAAAPDFTFPVRQPHSHNLPLGIMGDAGLLGLVAAVFLVGSIAWIGGPWRARSHTGRVAAYVLLGLAVGGLFEDLTFLPNFNLLAIALVAVVLSDAGAVSWIRFQPGRLRLPFAVGAAAITATLVGAMIVADAGAVAYRRGVDAAAAQQWTAAVDHFVRAVEIDPSQPTGHKALAVAADRLGRADLARRAAEQATALNPGDAPSWINLALVCEGLGDRECQARATERAVATAGFFEAELVNAAFSYEALARHDDADDAYRRSLLSQRLTSLATDWPRQLPIGDATLDDEFGPLFEFNRLLAWWAMGERIDPAAITDRATRALAHAIRGEETEAEAWLERAIAASPDQIVTWDIAVVLRYHWGRSVEKELAIAGAVRGQPFPDLDAESNRPGLTFDIATFRQYPGDGLVTAARRLQTDPLYPWSLQHTLP